MGGETGVPLPVIPKALADERLSSWLARMAGIYLVSPEELLAHIGLRTKRIHDLDLDPHADDIARLAVATGVSAPRLLRMTFRDAPASLRGFINVESEEICPSCVDEARPGGSPRLREWTYPFALWCAKHGRSLKSADIGGVGVLGDEAFARRGARFWRALAMGADETTPTAAAVLNLLLTPCRSPSPAAPWELAGASPRMRADLQKEPVRSLFAPGVELRRAGIRQRRRDLRPPAAARVSWAGVGAGRRAARGRNRTWPDDRLSRRSRGFHSAAL